jgi:hypothetical protein
VATDFDERIRRLLIADASAMPLTDAHVEQAEQLLGVRLPPDLISLLRHQNGGYINEEFEACPTTRPTSWAADHVAVTEIAGIGGSTSALSLLDTPYLNDEWGQPRDLVLLSGDGHSWIALDYRHVGIEGEPPVIFYENDSDGSPDELQLASSFREFVCMLIPQPPVDVET